MMAVLTETRTFFPLSVLVTLCYSQPATRKKNSKSLEKGTNVIRALLSLTHS